jgi:hypothetical protein
VTSWHLDEELDWQISPEDMQLRREAAQRGGGSEGWRSPNSSHSDVGAEDRGDDLRIAHKACAHVLYLRGKDWHLADVSGFRSPSLYAPWLPGIPFSVVGSPRQSRGIERSAVLLSNSQGAATQLDRVLDPACTLRAADAYLHQ